MAVSERETYEIDYCVPPVIETLDCAPAFPDSRLAFLPVLEAKFVLLHESHLAELVNDFETPARIN
ncbi:MAG: hypothetical protein ACK5AZ_25910 [Bryobacteraceae bacterium]